MTRDTARPVVGGGGVGHGNTEIDLLAGLWEEAPFARLPMDAPGELRELVEDIDNPKKVYAIHRASRRHNFQLLVQKYIVQLREGCGADCCTTPTCFTCRKRIVGKSPIRRYNTTSARTLAVYLASQDNPENGLCPTLKPPKGPPAALRSLHIRAPSKRQVRDERSPHAYKGQNGPGRNTQNEGKAGVGLPVSPSGTTAEGSMLVESEYTSAAEKISVGGRYVQKDYRSFAANMFETCAFKMLEWLTPNGVREMASNAACEEKRAERY
ncbi:Ubiquitin-protein ligase E3A [Coniochaeta hoffmannii]|uniref:Ubiquitin-protein ligase E3A n=1 Tax=Coniochaeta hoffmannii TaxID=91930 RepID=A0AA38S7U1_9PEZI|nr:Ubiquitin-protein ligase E3A [Coniochaeta hoffmannii]